MTKEEMVQGYVKLSSGIKFFYAYPVNSTGEIYGGYIEHEELEKICTVESESPENGSYKKLRVLVGQAKKAVKNPEYVGTVEELKQCKEELKEKFGVSYNNGDCFEYFMYKKNGIASKWKKNDTAFYKGGDLGNIQYKYNKASLSNEHCIMNGLIEKNLSL